MNSLLKGVIDRIEGDKAVILVSGGGEMYLPVAKLPGGAGEGSVLGFDITIDRKAEEERKKKVQDLQRRLQKGR